MMMMTQPINLSSYNALASQSTFPDVIKRKRQSIDEEVSDVGISPVSPQKKRKNESKNALLDTTKSTDIETGENKIKGDLDMENFPSRIAAKEGAKINPEYLAFMQLMLESEKNKTLMLNQKLALLQSNLCLKTMPQLMVPTSPLTVKSIDELDQYIVTDIAAPRTMEIPYMMHQQFSLTPEYFLANVRTAFDAMVDPEAPIPYVEHPAGPLSDAEVSVLKYFLC